MQALMAVVPLGFLITMYESQSEHHKFSFGVNYLMLTLAICIGVSVWVMMHMSNMSQGCEISPPRKHAPIVLCMITWLFLGCLFYCFVLH